VDAISIDRGTSWIGINQNRINGWVEQLLRCDGLKEIVSCVDAEVQHEVKILDSRLDLCILRGTSRTYIEIKTPIHDFLLTPQSRFTKPASKDYFARGIRHFHTLGELAAEGHRSIVILCFMYDACPFVPPNDSSGNAEVFETVRIAEKNGMESWQVNFTLTPDSFSVKRIQRLSLCKRAS
jgi:sugar fermentation stimulation protein A